MAYQCTGLASEATVGGGALRTSLNASKRGWSVQYCLHGGVLASDESRSRGGGPHYTGAKLMRWRSHLSLQQHC
jgi:hypothetical protein